MKACDCFLALILFFSLCVTHAFLPTTTIPLRTEFSHLVFYDNLVYSAAGNNVYKFNAELDLLQSATNPNICSPPCNGTTQLILMTPTSLRSHPDLLHCGINKASSGVHCSLIYSSTKGLIIKNITTENDWLIEFGSSTRAIYAQMKVIRTMKKVLYTTVPFTNVDVPVLSARELVHDSNTDTYSMRLGYSSSTKSSTLSFLYPHHVDYIYTFEVSICRAYILYICLCCHSPMIFISSSWSLGGRLTR